MPRIKKEHSPNYVLIQWIASLIIAIFLAIIVNKFIVFKVKIQSGSMVPTLSIGDRLLAHRVYNTQSLSRGDIIIFKPTDQSDLFIKRLIGLPGDEIIINKGSVSVNGKLLNEPYLETNLVFDGTFKVPTDSYFFLGDARDNSFDSRFWDYPYISSDSIKGKAFLTLYPFNKIEFF